jgi:glycosyltransferase involved in cell wall biosynthesis
LPTINPRLRIPWEQLLAPALLRRNGADVFHGTQIVAPLFCPVPSVITIHDLSSISFPQTFRWYNRLYLTWAARISARRASRILAVSEFTKREVVRLLGVPPEQIVVTHNACDARFHPPDPAELAEFKRRRGLPERFILFIGTLEPRKNLPTLFDAYARIASRADAPLIVGGGKGWLYDPIFAKAESLGLGDRLRFVGYIDEAEKPLWLAAATVFTYPSLFEGFGIPPLEAMACGTPVVVSDSSSLPEVVGDAGLIVPTTDADALGAALLQLLRDSDLRADMRERGLRQARRFSWRETAQRTLAAYHDACAGR